MTASTATPARRTSRRSATRRTAVTALLAGLAVGTVAVPGTAWAGPEAEITVAYSPDWLSVTVTSTKDLSNVVLQVCGGDSVKFDGLSGLTGTFTSASPIAVTYVKSGDNGGAVVDIPGAGTGAPFPGAACTQPVPPADEPPAEEPPAEEPPAEEPPAEEPPAEEPPAEEPPAEEPPAEQPPAVTTQTAPDPEPAPTPETEVLSSTVAHAAPAPAPTPTEATLTTAVTPRTLPFTGGRTAATALVGAGLLAAGVALALGGRRREQELLSE